MPYVIKHEDNTPRHAQEHYYNRDLQEAERDLREAQRNLRRRELDTMQNMERDARQDHYEIMRSESELYRAKRDLRDIKNEIYWFQTEAERQERLFQQERQRERAIERKKNLKLKPHPRIEHRYKHQN